MNRQHSTAPGILRYIRLMGRPWKTAWISEHWMLVGVVCVLLVVLAGTVQVTHIHTSKDASHSYCSLCVAVHAALHSMGSPAQAAPPALFEQSSTAADFRVRQRPNGFALFIRPPPARVAAA